MYQAIYRCQLCGGEFSDGETNENFARATTIMLSVDDSAPIYSNNKTYARTVHNCQDGSFGLADFMGFKKVEE